MVRREGKGAPKYLLFSVKTLRNDGNTVERDSNSERPSEGRERRRKGGGKMERERKKEREGTL